MSEFETIVEGWRSDIQKFEGIMQLGFGTINAEFRCIKTDLRELKDTFDQIEMKTNLLIDTASRLSTKNRLPYGGN